MVLEEEEEKESEEVIEHEKEVLVVEEASSARVEKRSVLRKGSEGEEVRQMQVPFCSLSLSLYFYLFISESPKSFLGL